MGKTNKQINPIKHVMVSGPPTKLFLFRMKWPWFEEPGFHSSCHPFCGSPGPSGQGRGKREGRSLPGVRIREKALRSI